MDAQYFPFYIILSNYVRSVLFYQNKDHNARQIRFHVYIKMRRYKRRVCKRKTLFGQPNIYIYIYIISEDIKSILDKSSTNSLEHFSCIILPITAVQRFSTRCTRTPGITKSAHSPIVIVLF